MAETKGARRQRQVLEAFRDTGIVTGRCRVDGLGTGQGAWCYSHGWSGVVQDCRIVREDRGYGRYDCPNQRIAAWIERRHAVAGSAA